MLLNTENRNAVKYTAMDASNGIAALLASGALFQSFLLNGGLDERLAGIITSVAYFTQLAAMFISLFFADRVGNPIKTMVYTNIPSALFFVGAAALCILDGGKTNISHTFFFWAITICVIIYNLFTGFRSVISYKLPYMIFDIGKYGRILAIDGTFTNILCTAASMGITVLLSNFSYRIVMTLVYCAGIVLTLLVSAMNARLCPINQVAIPSERSAERKSGIRVLFVPLKEKSFRRLFMPNVARGFSMGIVGCMALMAAYDYNLNSVQLSRLAILGTAAAVFGNLLYSFAANKANIMYLCLLSSVLVFVSAPMTLLFGGETLLYVSYFLLQSGVIVVNGTIPVLVTQFVPYNVIGGYTSLRMMITTASSAAASMLSGIAIGIIPSWVMLCAAGAAQLYCGIEYFMYMKSIKKSE